MSALKERLRDIAGAAGLLLAIAYILVILLGYAAIFALPIIGVIWLWGLV